MTEEVKIEKSESEKKKEDWMNSKWRPMMGWMYMIVCFCDFVVFPVFWSILQVVAHVGQITQWQPLTLQGAGLFHLAMGAVLGIAAYGRTQEKLGGANNGGLPVPGSGTTPVSAAPAVPSASLPMSPAVAPVPPVVTSIPVPVNASGKKLVPEEPRPEI